MNSFIDAAINRARTTLLIMAMVVIAGLIARAAIPVENDPRIEVPFFIINILHEGISPEDAERLLAMPLEIELRTVEGVKEFTSYASEGFGTVMVEFDADYDLDTALMDVREAVDRTKPELPSTAEEPIVREANTDDFPILQVNLVGEDVPERVLYNLAIELRDAIEGIPNVLDAEIQGHREELLEAVINPRELEAYQISNEELISTIMRNNRLIPAGSLDTGQGRFAVKVPSVIEEARDIFDLPVRASGDTVVTLDDIATIRRTFKDRTSYARVNGNETISLNVIKRANANIIDTIDAVKAIAERHRKKLPGRVDIFYSQDQAPFAQSQVTELQGNIFTALAFIMVIVVAAMGFRSGVIVGLSIPISFLFSLIFIYLLGYTFNFMVMFGMLLGLGMLIDGAIVVTEYADRKMTEGFDSRSAYALAAKRMFWPVTASIATTLAAFLPLMFWPGISGKFMRFLPVTVFTVLSGSLLYALVFGPTLGSIFGRAGSRDDKAMNTLKQLEDGDPTQLSSITGVYARILEFCARYSALTLAITLMVLFTTFWAYANYGKGMTYFTDSEPMFAQVTVRARGNLSADEINDLVSEVEEQILQVRGILGINTYTTLPGGPSRNGGFDHVGQIFVELHPEDERDRSGTEILEEIRERTAPITGIVVEVKKQEQGPYGGKPIEIQFTSHNRDLLEPAVERVVQYLDSSVDGLRDLEDTRSMPGIEWKLTVDRAQAALYGADVSQVGIAVQLVTNGVKVGEYRPDKADDAVDIRVRYPAGERGIAALDELKVSTVQGLIPISNFVSREAGPNVDTIQRIDGMPVEYIRADVAPGVLADTKVREIQAWLENQTLDPDLTIEFRGTNEEQNKAMAFVSLAFLLSLLLMFVLLVTQFNSFYQSTLILFAVILSMAGVLLGLLATGKPFSTILTGVGVVALAGIVVNNNIVLIDTYNHLRREHPELDYIALIVRTGAQRLRPVVLTTVTTVFGLLPLASNFSVDLINRSIIHGGMMSSFWVPLSQAIVSGLSFAALLTLVTTPAMLAVPHQLRALSARTGDKRRERGGDTEEALA
ncbi:MAG: efflux RND transporter permease subunit [Pseudomonadales bacterium]|jgi:multidrug efflux pump|nr:efflux RND transporter permease subunit [Pseudomonadales bacterium]MDP6470450.1 efflux RND transporter permease subunit [Pseudomonadales bacterium]MDP6827752.1 efflux RND transporter permease subunit [Pseudomonadales bacterium]MDP6973394.1 efflux RND transporter permease subunit [Pseudomonadales bacterium]